MRYLNLADYSVMAIYSGILVVMAIYLQRRATANMESYFLGGRKLPWWALGICGMSSFLDMTGTMVIVSFLYMLGPRGLFIEFRGGAVLVLAFMMLWTGKWHRRSNCMTGAEWNIYRFGAGRDAQAARYISALSFILFTIGMLAYLIKGAGLFLSMFLPFSPLTCAVLMVGLTTLYTVTAGFLGVVYTDIFQSVIILASVVVVAVMAIVQVNNSAVPLPELATQVTHAEQWMSSVPHWYTSMPKGYEDYSYLFLFASFYLLRTFLSGMGQTGADPRFFGARNERECGVLTFFWTWLMTFRWPMMMGFAVLGLFLINKLFPDQSIVQETEVAIKQHMIQQARPDLQVDFERATALSRVVPQREWSSILKVGPAAVDAEQAGKLAAVLGPDWPADLKMLTDQQAQVAKIIPKHKWEEYLAYLIHKPESEPRLTATIQRNLGERWDEKLNLVSYEGTVNPERVLPAVILMMIPMGLRGLFIVSLVAAAMSTFSPTVNIAVAQFTRDIYQGWARPKARNFELMTASYVFGVMLVLAGFGMAYWTKSINDIWDWIIMGLTAGMAVPSVLRLYWWRFNAMGVVIGTVVGVVAAMVDRGLAIMGFFDWINQQNTWFHWNSVWEFSILTAIGFIGCLIGTYMTAPTDRRVLEHFYKTTRPFGFWGPLRAVLSPEQQLATRRENRNDIIALPFALLWQITLFILPMQMIIGAWDQFWPTLGLFLLGLGGVMIFWYRNLPPARDGVENGGDLELVRSFYEKPALPAEPVAQPVKIG